MIRAAALVSLLMSLPAAAREVTSNALDDPATYAGAEIVLLGEVHDNPVHHARQAEAVRAIAPKAVVWEMLTPDAEVDPALIGDPDALGAALGWADSGWPDFAMYAPIFAAAPDAAHRGAALTANGIRLAVEDGAASPLGAGAIPLGLDQPLPPAEQAAEEALQAEVHCGMMPEDMLAGMVEVQRARDGALALTALAALEEHGPPVAVILGNGHAEAGAVPALVERARPGTAVLALGQLESAADAEVPYDLWARADAPAREGDPCDRLR